MLYQWGANNKMIWFLLFFGHRKEFLKLMNWSVTRIFKGADKENLFNNQELR